MAIKIVSINIEFDRHLPEVIAFLKAEDPDVVCVQELFLADVALLQGVLEMGFVFSPTYRIDSDTKYGFAPRGLAGVALFSRIPLECAQILPYRGSAAVLPKFMQANDSTLSVITAECKKDGQNYVIATTHFTWSPNGKVSDAQLTDVAVLKEKLSKFPELILTGDMNAPRGGEIFAKIGAGMRDAIPAEVTTTIDPDLHYSGGLDLVVDALFLSEAYTADSVRVVGGVSDHKAIVAEISRS